MDPKPETRNALSRQIESDAAKVGVLLFISEDWRTWHFRSTEDPEDHWTVDLAEWDASGACSCPDFDIRIRPLLRDRVIRPHTDRAKCKHIRRAEKVLCYRIKKNLFSQSKPET